ncbi:MAG: fumarate hydratase C-terminal domain-containing protein [Nitrospinota bacterium]
MESRTFELRIPLEEDEIRELRTGDAVYLTGRVFTARSKFHIQGAEQGHYPRLDYGQMNCIIHIGPVFRKEEGGWRPVGFDPTTSYRFEKWAPKVIRELRLRAMVGKTTMGKGTAEACREVGCVHLSRVGLPGSLLCGTIERVVGVHGLEELGMTEATWVLDVNRLGPFIVSIDTRGENLFDNLEGEFDRRFRELYRRFQIPEDFEYTLRVV